MAISIPSQVAFMYRQVKALPAVGPNSKTSQILEPGEIIEVTAPASGLVIVLTSTSPGAAQTSTNLANGAAQSFGPNNEQTTVVVINQPPSQGDALLSIARLNR